MTTRRRDFCSPRVALYLVDPSLSRLQGAAAAVVDAQTENTPLELPPPAPGRLDVWDDDGGDGVGIRITAAVPLPHRRHRRRRRV